MHNFASVYYQIRCSFSRISRCKFKSKILLPSRSQRIQIFIRTSFFDRLLRLRIIKQSCFFTCLLIFLINCSIKMYLYRLAPKNSICIDMLRQIQMQKINREEKEQQRQRRRYKQTTRWTLKITRLDLVGRIVCQQCKRWCASDVEWCVCSNYQNQTIYYIILLIF